VARLFPRASLVEVPATGHSAIGTDVSGCASGAFTRFFRDRPVPPGCPRQRRRFPPAPPPPPRLAEVRGLRGTSGVRGRTLAAVKLTLDDVAADSATAYIFDRGGSDLARAGGLRAGTYRIDRRGALVLDGLAFVPGVKLSGRIERFGERRQRGRLRIGGGAGSRGLLRVERQGIRGVLGGRRVRARLDGPPVRAVLSAQRPRWPLPRF
jgi:hypothetical protein